MFNIENIAEYVNNYEILNGKVHQKENHEEIMDEELILKIKAARMIYNEVVTDFRINKNENIEEFEQAIIELANIINDMSYENPKGDIISAILTNQEHLSRTLTLNANTKEEAIEEINRQNLSESLLLPPKYDNTLSLLKLKFRESNLDIDDLEVNLEQTENNTWELTVDYKVKEYKKEEQNRDDLDEFEREQNGRTRTLEKIKNLQEYQNALRIYETFLNMAIMDEDYNRIDHWSNQIEEIKKEIDEILADMQFETPDLDNTETENLSEKTINELNSLEEVQNELEQANQKLKEAQEKNNSEKENYYKERIEALENREVELMISKAQEKNEELNFNEESFMNEKDVSEITSIEEINKEYQKADQYIRINGDKKEVVDYYRDHQNALMARIIEINIENFLKSNQSEDITNVESQLDKYKSSLAIASNEWEIKAYEEIIIKLEARLAELRALPPEEDIPDYSENIEKETENRIKLEELYSNELPIEDGLFTFQEFEDYLRDYKYEEGTVYERKNSEEVTNEEIILKMKAIYLVDTLARQEIKEKINGYDPVVLPENIINHFLHVFSEERLENDDINNIINAILKSEGHFEYTTEEIMRTDKTIEEDIKEQKGLKSVLALFINPIRDCTEAVITLLQRKKGLIQERINTLIEDVEGKIKLTVDYFIKKQEKKVEPNPNADVLSVDSVRFYFENFDISNNQIYARVNHELITDETLILNIRIAHLIYKYACLSIPNYDEIKLFEDDNTIQETIAKFSMYSNDKISQLLKTLVLGACEENKEEFYQYEYIAFNLNSNNNMFDEMAVMEGLDLYDELNIFNKENLENTKALLIVLFRKMGLNLEEFNVQFEPIENQAMKLVFNYKMENVHKKKKEENNDKIKQARLFSIDDIKYYAKNYVRNEYGELCWRDNGEIETNEEIVILALSSKFINNIVRNLKEKDASYNLNSREENLSIAYDKVLNNYVINDILNNLNHVEYVVNSDEIDEDLEFVFDKRNKSLFEYYIRDQFRNLGYDIEHFKMNAEWIGENKICYSIDYQVIKLEQNLESEPLEEFENQNSTDFTTFTPTIAINILNKFIDESIEDEYKMCTLSEKKVLLNAKMRGTDIDNQLVLQIGQEAIELIECYEYLVDLNNKKAKALREKDDLAIKYLEKEILEVYNEKALKINLSDDELSLLPVIELNAYFYLKESIEEIMDLNGFIFSETETNNNNNNENNNKDYNEENSNSDNKKNELPDVNTKMVYGILGEINDEIAYQTVSYGDLMAFKQYIIDLKLYANSMGRMEFISSLEPIEAEISTLMNYCNMLLYIDESNHTKYVQNNNQILLFDIMAKPKKRKFEYFVDSNVEINIKDVILGIKGSLKNLDILAKEFEIPLEEEERQNMKI